MKAPEVLQLDRMAVEEAGYSAVALADAIQAQVGQVTGAVNIHQIALGLDILEIVEAPLTNFEGGLLTQAERTNGVILVNALSRRNRRRFTIAHELLHFLNDRHVQTDGGFRCRKTDISLTQTKTQPGMTRHLRQEAEANRFAAEVLAPRSRFAAYLRQPPDLQAVLDLSQDLEISKEVTARRFVELGDGMTIVFHRNGKVRYASKRDGYPRLLLRTGDLMPAMPGQPGKSELTGQEDVDADDWLVQPKGRVLTAQTLFQSDGYAMTLLVCDGADDDPDADKNGVEDTYARYTRWD